MPQHSLKYFLAKARNFHLKHVRVRATRYHSQLLKVGSTPISTFEKHKSLLLLFQERGIGARLKQTWFRHRTRLLLKCPQPKH
jgi:hypothetical protein